MGDFAGKYTPPAQDGPPKLSPEETAVLVEEKVIFPITAVRTGSNDQGSFFVCEIEIEGEARTKFFGRGSVYTRDDLLESYKKYLEEDGATPELFILTMNKRSQILVLVDENGEAIAAEGN